MYVGRGAPNESIGRGLAMLEVCSDLAVLAMPISALESAAWYLGHSVGARSQSASGFVTA